MTVQDMINLLQRLPLNYTVAIRIEYEDGSRSGPGTFISEVETPEDGHKEIQIVFTNE